MAVYHIIRRAAATISGYWYGFDGMMKSVRQTRTGGNAGKILPWVPRKINAWKAKGPGGRRRRAINPDKRKSPRRNFLFMPTIVIAALAASTACIIYEITTSRGEALYLKKTAAGLTFSVAPGPSGRIRFPRFGPYDRRLGYTDIPRFVKRLRKNGFIIKRQAVISSQAARIFDKGYTIPYPEKQRAGITVVDRQGRALYKAAFPSPVYAAFDSIPKPAVDALLAIEDKNLLDTLHSYRNPAIDWGRLVRAAGSFGASKLGIKTRMQGGSTLATQMEKYRHSPGGRTTGPLEKLRQWVCASLRVYKAGENTVAARKEIALQYINTAPLGAYPGHGEVAGLGEGLGLWYGADFDSVNNALKNRAASPLMRARSLRMVLGMLLAHKRPEFYLVSDTAALGKKTDDYLRILRARGEISESLCTSALSAHVAIKSPLSATESPQGPADPLPPVKTANMVLDPLMGLLAVHGKYELTRLDCTVKSTLDSAATSRVVGFFGRLKNDGAFLDSLRLRGRHMLDIGNQADVVYGLGLFEKKDGANLTRISADSYGAPLNFNDGVRLDLGSAAKLRTLITYLEAVEELHGRLSMLKKNELFTFTAVDPLSRWARAYYACAEDTGLGAMLDSSLNRRYSASPAEGFFTGGGLHRFENFNHDDNDRVVSIREAFTYSINLVFIRIMRDIVDYYIAMDSQGSPITQTDGMGKTRWESYLNRFVNHESEMFLSDFYRQLKNVPPFAMADTLASEIKPSLGRLAVIYSFVDKDPTVDGLKVFLLRRGISDTSNKTVENLLARSKEYGLSDRGYIAKIHPLKLFTARYFAQNPSRTLGDLKRASRPYQHEAYRWIFTQNRLGFQRSRVRIMLEIDAFDHILKSWKKQGYPFNELTPSYATAIGASGDRPTSLAELAGIIQNEGVKLPTRQIEELEFGANTPYETVLENSGAPNKRVLSIEVAQMVRGCMTNVVKSGTAIQAARAFDSLITVAGKTGTGDHRRRFFGPHGIQTGEAFVDRAACFVFLIGDPFFGTITVAVLGPDSKNFDFTSSYPVRLFTCLAPDLVSLLDGKPETGP